MRDHPSGLMPEGVIEKSVYSVWGAGVRGMWWRIHIW
jgi:hypothetical protein